MVSATDREVIERDYGRSGLAFAAMAEVDWASHNLGSPAGWPIALRIALRNMLGSAEAMYLTWGPDHAFFYNDAFIVMMDAQLVRSMGESFQNLWNNYPTVEPIFKKALAGQATKYVDLYAHHARRAGSPDSWWTFSYSPLFDIDGSVAGVHGIITETTEYVLARAAQAQVNAALEESQSRLRRAQEAGKVGLFAIDVAADSLSGTAEFFRMFGVGQADSIPAETIEKLVIAEDQNNISHADERRREAIALQVEYRIRRPDNGEIRCIERRGEFEHDEVGRPIRLLGVVQDVTERRAARDALAALNATLETRVAERTAERNLLATIMEETDAFIQVVDLDFRWLAINPASAAEFARIFGTIPKVGDSMLELLADQPEERAAVQAIWARALAGEEFTAVGEFGDPRFVSDRRSYEMRFNTLRNEQGERIGAFQIVSDITDRVRAEAAFAQMQEALRQSQKMEAMGQLTGGVAHDFNNLLTPIMGGLDMLQRRAGLSDREARLIDGALQSAERARILVQRLLAFARRQPLQPGAVDMAVLVAGMADLVASTSGPQVQVRTDMPVDLPAALADSNQLEMAILNLCVNARDAMPDGGTITIAARVEPLPVEVTDVTASGPHMRLSVIDTGTGMDEEVRRRSIEPFFSTKGVGKGTGLGLSMVHGLAVQLGGAMTIASTPGFGTRIDLWLPLSTDAATPAEGSVQPPAPAPSVRGRVLVVDDEPLVRMTTVVMLESLGYDTEEADSAMLAERRLRDGELFDLIVTDHLMPGTTGAELAATVRRHWPRLPVLLVSGYADVEGIAPDIPRLTKPFREAELAQAIAGLG